MAVCFALSGNAVNDFESRIAEYTRSQALPGNAMQPRLRLDSSRRSLGTRNPPTIRTGIELRAVVKSHSIPQVGELQRLLHNRGRFVADGVVVEERRLP